MNDRMYLVPNPIKGGRLGVMVRNESGHPIQYYYGRMTACIKWAALRWPGHKIVECDAKGQVVISCAPPVA